MKYFKQAFLIKIPLHVHNVLLTLSINFLIHSFIPALPTHSKFLAGDNGKLSTSHCQIPVCPPLYLFADLSLTSIPDYLGGTIAQYLFGRGHEDPFGKVGKNYYIFLNINNNILANFVTHHCMWSIVSFCFTYMRFVHAFVTSYWSGSLVSTTLQRCASGEFGILNWQ